MDIGPHRSPAAGTYPFTVSNSFARFVDRTYSAEITRIGWAVRQPPASTHIVACTTCIAQALCSRQIFYHIRAFFASPFLKKSQTFLRSDADARPLGAQRPGVLRRLERHRAAFFSDVDVFQVQRQIGLIVDIDVIG